MFIEEIYSHQQFYFCLLHFWGHILGEHNVETLTFPVWIRPWVYTKRSQVTRS